MWTYVASDLNGKETLGMFKKKELQKTDQDKFRVENIINGDYKLSFIW